METRHVKFEYGEALGAKKNLLSTELNILQTAKHVRNYKLLRKKELALKNRLNSAIKTLNSNLNSIRLTFPEEEKPKFIKKKERIFETQRQRDIKRQLEDIQDRLAKLQ